MKQFTLLILIICATIKITIAQESEPDYLYFEVSAGTTIKFGSPSMLEYSFDKITWTSLTSSGVTSENDSKVYFRGDNPYGLNSNKFSISQSAKCSGNIMTLIDKTGQLLSIPSNGCFQNLFATTTASLVCPIYHERNFRTLFLLIFHSESLEGALFFQNTNEEFAEPCMFVMEFL